MARSKSRRSGRRPLTIVPDRDPSAMPVDSTSTLEPSIESPPAPPRARSSGRKPNLVVSTSLCLIRLSIIGAGIGAIIGTLLTTISPSQLLAPEAVAAHSKPEKGESRLKPQQLMASVGRWLQPASEQTAPNPNGLEKTSALVPGLAPTAEVAALKQKIVAIAKPLESKIKPYAYFIDVDNGQFINLEGEISIAAASTIKIPIAIAFFEAVDAGKAHLHEELPLTKDVIGSGSGDMQYQVGKVKSYSALETVTKMIVISDNTATNMLIQRLGGQSQLNQRFKEWGLQQTIINNPLPDLEGTNKTSTKDLADSLILLHQGNTLSMKSRDRLMNIMQGTHTRTLLPQGLEADAVIAHKTGDIGTILGDAGIIDMPNGKRYIGAVMATRPHNDPAARKLIQDISRTVYQHFKATTPPAPVPAAVSAPQKPEPMAESSPSPKPQN